MTVNMQYVQMPESESLSEIVNRNLEKLAHKYQFVIRAEVFFKLGNGTDGKNKICVRLWKIMHFLHSKTNAFAKNSS